MKITIGRIVFDSDSGEATIVMTEAFEALDSVTKADVMRDAVFDSQQMYAVAVDGIFPKARRLDS